MASGQIIILAALAVQAFAKIVSQEKQMIPLYLIENQDSALTAFTNTSEIVSTFTELIDLAADDSSEPSPWLKIKVMLTKYVMNSCS